MEQLGQWDDSYILVNATMYCHPNGFLYLNSIWREAPKLKFILRN